MIIYFLRPNITASLLVSIIVLSTLFSNIHNTLKPSGNYVYMQISLTFIKSAFCFCRFRMILGKQRLFS
jgi:hypothetical protein